MRMSVAWHRQAPARPSARRPHRPRAVHGRRAQLTQVRTHLAANMAGIAMPRVNVGTQTIANAATAAAEAEAAAAGAGATKATVSAAARVAARAAAAVQATVAAKALLEAAAVDADAGGPMSAALGAAAAAVRARIQRAAMAPPTMAHLMMAHDRGVAATAAMRAEAAAAAVLTQAPRRLGEPLLLLHASPQRLQRLPAPPRLPLVLRLRACLPTRAHRSDRRGMRAASRRLLLCPIPDARQPLPLNVASVINRRPCGLPRQYLTAFLTQSRPALEAKLGFVRRPGVSLRDF